MKGLKKGVNKLKGLNLYTSIGREINSFSDSNLAPKLFKVVANSKNIFRHF